MDKICIVVGTRPEVIKMSPIIRYLEENNKDYFIIHTNQHYDKEMDEIFFRELELPLPKYNLKVKSGSHARITGNALMRIERILKQEMPKVVLAEGDTNSVLATALATKKLHMKFGHIEAGLRSRDMNMPEELNRIMADHISDYLFVPTEEAKKNAFDEKVYGRIFLTGNTIVDAVQQNLTIAKKKSHIMKCLHLKNKKYFLLTFHREENVDDPVRFAKMLKGIYQVADKYKMRVIFPMHPRTKKRAKQYLLAFPYEFKIIKPVGYLDMLLLMKNAAIIFTDSGGIQEEACILKTPCVTLRDNTERPETLKIKANFLAGVDNDKILHAVKQFEKRNPDWENPYGDGTAGKQIIEVLENELSSS